MLSAPLPLPQLWALRAVPLFLEAPAFPPGSGRIWTGKGLFSTPSSGGSNRISPGPHCLQAGAASPRVPRGISSRGRYYWGCPFSPRTSRSTSSPHTRPQRPLLPTLQTASPCMKPEDQAPGLGTQVPTRLRSPTPASLLLPEQPVVFAREMCHKPPSPSFPSASPSPSTAPAEKPPRQRAALHGRPTGRAPFPPTCLTRCSSPSRKMPAWHCWWLSWCSAIFVLCPSRPTRFYRATCPVPEASLGCTESSVESHEMNERTNE